MKKHAATIAALAFIGAMFLFATVAVGAPAYRIFGKGEPSLRQMKRHHYRFDGHRMVRYQPVVLRNKYR